MRKALVLLLLFFAFGLSLTTLPQFQKQLPISFGSGSISQLKCGHASLANFQSTSVTFTGSVTAGHLLAAVVAVQGSANTVINWVNVTDNVDAGQFKQWVRTTDFANSLMVALYSFNNTAGGASGVSLSAELKNTANNNQNVEICAYDISGIAGSSYTVTTNHQEGGGASLATGTTGDVTLSGDAGNSAGGALTFSGTADDVSGANFGAGHGTGTWTGLTGVAFNEEADASFTSSTPTSTQPVRCSMFQVGPQATLTLSGGSPSPSTVLCDGATHNITVNSNATLALTEPASTSTNRNVFTGAATVLTHVICASGTCALFSFTNYFQDNDTYNWTPPLACPGFCIAQKPKVTVSFIGASTTFNLQPSNGTILTTPKTAQWIDNNTAWTTTNPFFYNNAYWTPSPNGGTIRGSPTITITYSAMVPSNQTCTSHDPFTLFSKMCFVPGFIYSYGNILGVSNFLTIIWLIFASAIFLKSGSPILTVTFLLIGFAVFSGLAIGVGGSAASGISSTGWQIGLIALVLVLGGTVVRLFVGRNS